MEHFDFQNVLELGSPTSREVAATCPENPDVNNQEVGSSFMCLPDLLPGT